MRRTTLLGAAALAAHAAPVLLCNRPFRRRCFPSLAGIGDPGKVALTFDDGPDPKSTAAFLSALDDLGWQATFFMIGSMVRYAPDLAAEVAAAGHEVAVHGDRHTSHAFRTPADVFVDVAKAKAETEDVTQAELRWFRPPYGELSTSSLVAARRNGLRTVLWSSWGRDWREQATPESIVADVRRELTPGATVLLHDSDCTSSPGSWKATLGALPALAELFAENGLKPGPLAGHGLSD